VLVLSNSIEIVLIYVTISVVFDWHTNTELSIIIWGQLCYIYNIIVCACKLRINSFVIWWWHCCHGLIRLYDTQFLLVHLARFIIVQITCLLDISLLAGILLVLSMNVCSRPGNTPSCGLRVFLSPILQVLGVNQIICVPVKGIWS